MKKLFLSLILLIFIALSAISQSFIGQSSTYIKSSVLKDFSSDISNVSYTDNILSITFSDGHTALYFTNSGDLCKYYALCYPISKYYSVYDMINSKFIKDSSRSSTWYQKDGEYYIYYQLLVDKGGKVCWMFVYPDFYENDVKAVIDLL